ncbi:hypothetical protein ACLEIY_17940 [Acetobacter tropicalis]
MRLGGDGATGRCYRFLESTTTWTCARMSKAFIAAVLQNSPPYTSFTTSKAGKNMLFEFSPVLTKSL